MSAISMVQKIRSQIELDIQSGKYQTGERLPTERELSERFHVSHMTVRRALVDLVDKQIIVSRPRAGMFVGRTQELTDTRPAVLLLACDYKSQYIQDEINAVGAVFEKKGWRTDLVRSSGSNLQQAAKLILEMPTVILNDQIFENSPISRAVEQTRQPVLLIGEKTLGERAIPSVTNDHEKGLLAVLELMEELNPARIATLWVTRLEGYPETPVFKAFRMMGSRFTSIRSLFALTPPFVSETERAYQVMQQHLKDEPLPPTILFCSSDASAIGAMAAVRDAGLNIPDDVAIIAYSDSCLCKYTTPSLTAVNMDLTTHGEKAVALMEKMVKDPEYRPTTQVMIRPKLVMRQSTPALAGVRSVAR